MRLTHRNTTVNHLNTTRFTPGAYSRREYSEVFGSFLPPSFTEFIRAEDGDNGKHPEPSPDLVETESEADVETEEESEPTNGGAQDKLINLRAKLALFVKEKVE